MDWGEDEDWEEEDGVGKSSGWVSEENVDGMTFWESNSTLSPESDSVDLLGDLLWDFKRFNKLDILLVTSDAAGGVGVLSNKHNSSGEKRGRCTLDVRAPVSSQFDF